MFVNRFMSLILENFSQSSIPDSKTCFLFFFILLQMQLFYVLKFALRLFIFHFFYCMNILLQVGDFVIMSFSFDCLDITHFCDSFQFYEFCTD